MICLDDEADIVNPVRLEGSVQPKRGAGARPLRKRAYYRAIERKEPWALMRKLERSVMKDVEMRMLYAKTQHEEWMIQSLSETLK